MCYDILCFAPQNKAFERVIQGILRVAKAYIKKQNTKKHREK
ncbi:hypothetical protein HMPREF9145_0073 [Segatella salivae F0493]|uniref:Uncharacterized protein n=1 Tax=Segatella salivae F0493 TaxID=1395125 RepID=U2KTE9_9BACT|nr:hypothetical protein HMPREF9145_0073 [Segatella salivae F0493]